MNITAVELARKVLRVNLTTSEISTELLSEEVVRQYIGGATLGAKILYDEVKPNVEAFDPENRLIFTTGIVTGTSAPATCLYNVCTKGPITNLATSAQANGYFGLRLKQAGFSTIIIEGKADTWKYLVIENGEAVLKDAEHLVGKNTFQTETMVKEELGSDKKACVATIGPSGENLVRYAAIQSDLGHFASSNGPGSVMGSKKLKAIAVYGDFKIEPVQVANFKEAIKTYVQNLMQAPPAIGLSKLGTGLLIPIAYKIGFLPTKNLSDYNFPENEIYDAAAVKQNPAYEFKKNSCYACPIGHCKDLTFKDGPYAGRTVDEPEYEGWQAFSGLIGVTDVSETIMLNTMNDEFGMDLKEMGYTLAWAIECYEKGYLTKEDTDGLELTWGNVEAIKELLRKVAYREGFGAKLAEGVMRVSKMYGKQAEKCAVYAKRGAAPHIHDPRGNYSVALAQAFSENASIFGAVDRAPNPEFGFETPIPFTESDAHPTLLARGVPKVSFLDTYMICNFAAINVPRIIAILNALTGWEMNEKEAMNVGSRHANILRAFNILHGATAEDDNLSDRLKDPVLNGPNKGKALGPILDESKIKYYKEMGWNETTSYPLPETLKKLNLEYVISDLYGSN